MKDPEEALERKWSTMFRFFRISRSLAIVIALAVSLAANALLFVGGVLYNVVDDFLESATGLQTASAKQRKRVRSLKKENRQLRGQIKKVRTVAYTAAERTVNRSVKFARRSVATLAGKAIPVAGAAVSAGVTAWEIKDLCDTIRDMDSIRREIDPPEAAADNGTTVCSMSVPTPQEILAQVVRSPKAAWEKSRKFLPDLSSLKDVRSSLKDALKGAWKNIISFLGWLK